MAQACEFNAKAWVEKVMRVNLLMLMKMFGENSQWLIRGITTYLHDHGVNSRFSEVETITNCISGQRLRPLGSYWFPTPVLRMGDDLPGIQNPPRGTAFRLVLGSIRKACLDHLRVRPFARHNLLINERVRTANYRGLNHRDRGIIN